ncbi:MAG TPA: LysR substrate-binding domain-containing protein [Jatrophihabitans sp.]|jgi:DNA-binding transcriptional LysR family regulator|uniref:LysR family transcriptional regulator n=1 Tax=Jatrophihabitans sp. TaxID=1932789 RepID=UPI002EF25088
MLEIGLLRALHAVATGGSINAAADALHVTNSAVSQRLAKLERDVGQVMLERHGRGVRLTDAAKLLVDHAEQILSRVDAAETALEGHRGAVVGRLSIAAFPTAARGLLPHTMRMLRADYPQLHPVLHEQDPMVSVPLVVRGDVDVAIVQDWYNAPLEFTGDLERAYLLDDGMDLALPLTHPLSDHACVAIEDVARDPWVSWPRGTVCGDWLRHRLRGLGVEPRIEHAVAEYPTQLAMVAAGFGVALIPRLGRSTVPAGVRMVAVTPALTRQVYAVWRAETTHRPALRATIDALIATTTQLSDEPAIQAAEVNSAY